MKHLCPRRKENPGPFNLPETDSWFARDGELLQCSYCGSIHPDRFMELVRAGNEVTPTDKSYKAYIKVGNPNPKELRIVGSANFAQPGYIKATEEHREALKKSGWDDDIENRWICFAERGETRSEKFYFQHLSVEQMKEFTELYNAKKIVLAYPGHFYRKPFFWKS